MYGGPSHCALAAGPSVARVRTGTRAAGRGVARDGAGLACCLVCYRGSFRCGVPRERGGARRGVGVVIARPTGGRFGFVRHGLRGVVEAGSESLGGLRAARMRCRVAPWSRMGPARASGRRRVWWWFDLPYGVPRSAEYFCATPCVSRVWETLQTVTRGPMLPAARVCGAGLARETGGSRAKPPSWVWNDASCVLFRREEFRKSIRAAPERRAGRPRHRVGGHLSVGPGVRHAGAFTRGASRPWGVGFRLCWGRSGNRTVPAGGNTDAQAVRQHP